MTEDELAAFVVETVRETTFPIKNILIRQLNIPPSMLGLPDDFFLFVNDRRFEKFSDYGDTIVSEVCERSYVPYPNNKAAAYNHQFKALEFSSRILKEESSDAEMTEEALCDILTCHEIVHALMHNYNGAGNSQWPMSDEVRYIHEAVALKCNLDLFENIYTVATTDDVSKYLTHLETVSRKREKEGVNYLPFFDEYKKEPTSSYWKSLKYKSTILSDACAQHAG